MKERQTPHIQDRNRENKSRYRIDRTLLELSVGSLAWGLLCQLTIVWFVEDKVDYSIGLWLGIFLAVAAGIHMWWSLDCALDYEQDTAVKRMTRYNLLRYGVIVLVMGIIMVGGFANPLSAFLGVMGLKVSAYIQPFTHKICSNLYKEGI